MQCYTPGVILLMWDTSIEQILGVVCVSFKSVLINITLISVVVASLDGLRLRRVSAKGYNLISSPLISFTCSLSRHKQIIKCPAYLATVDDLLPGIQLHEPKIQKSFWRNQRTSTLPWQKSNARHGNLWSFELILTPRVWDFIIN